MFFPSWWGFDKIDNKIYIQNFFIRNIWYFSQGLTGTTTCLRFIKLFNKIFKNKCFSPFSFHFLQLWYSQVIQKRVYCIHDGDLVLEVGGRPVLIVGDAFIVLVLAWVAGVTANLQNEKFINFECSSLAVAIASLSLSEFVDIQNLSSLTWHSNSIFTILLIDSW